MSLRLAARKGGETEVASRLYSDAATKEEHIRALMAEADERQRASVAAVPMISQVSSRLVAARRSEGEQDIVQRLYAEREQFEERRRAMQQSSEARSLEGATWRPEINPTSRELATRRERGGDWAERLYEATTTTVQPDERPSFRPSISPNSERIAARSARSSEGVFERNFSDSQRMEERRREAEETRRREEQEMGRRSPTILAASARMAARRNQGEDVVSRLYKAAVEQEEKLQQLRQGHGTSETFHPTIDPASARLAARKHGEEPVFQRLYAQPTAQRPPIAERPGSAPLTGRNVRRPSPRYDNVSPRVDTGRRRAPTPRGGAEEARGGTEAL